MNKPDIYLVDVDHTLVTTDTYWLVMRAGWKAGKWYRMLWLLWIPRMIWCCMVGRSLGAMKGVLLMGLVGVTAEEQWKTIVLKALPQLILPKVNIALLQNLKLAKAQGHTIVLVSASPALWIQPLSEYFGFDCLATQLEIKQGHFTGRLKGANCKGSEKVRRIQKVYDLSAFHNIFAWGNAGDDEAMLNLAPRHHQFRI